MDDSRVFYELAATPSTMAALQILADEQSRAAEVEAGNHVEAARFHEAVLERGKQMAWGSLIHALKDRAKGYARPQTEF